ncbi:surface glycoprotein, partial [Haloplanus sp. C73]|uniref:surface glycoprotein n=1 Tax=Haloplanus sp. C73 TaxID=3421641 RepID=UPI003EC04853
MTDYNDKVRAVVLAALMVFSVFAGTVAFSGAAAGVNSGSGSFATFTNDTDVDEQTTRTHNINFTFDGYTADGNTDTYTLAASPASGVNVTSTTVNSVVINGTDITGSAGVSTNDPDSDGSAEELLVTFQPDNSTVGTGNLTGSVDVTVDIQTENVGSDTTATVTSSLDDSSDSTSTSASRSFTIRDVSGPGGATRAGPGGSGSFDTQDGDGVVYDGATVFQGESSIELAGNISGGVVKTAGDAEGVPLETPDIPQDQATGRYTTDGQPSSDGVTVQTPRVTTLDIENQYGEDIAGGSVPQGDDSSGSGELTVVGAWNYENAENLELTVENEDGLDVTGTAVTNGDTRTAGDVTNNEVTYDVDLSDLNTGTFTFTLEGTDDL